MQDQLTVVQHDMQEVGSCLSLSNPIVLIMVTLQRDRAIANLQSDLSRRATEAASVQHSLEETQHLLSEALSQASSHQGAAASQASTAEVTRLQGELQTSQRDRDQVFLSPVLSFKQLNCYHCCTAQPTSQFSRDTVIRAASSACSRT